MFKKLKQFFSKTRTLNSEYSSDLEKISFTDLKGSLVHLEVIRDGNSPLLKLSLDKQSLEIILDHEQSIILSMVLSEFGNKQTIINLLQNILKE